VLMLDLRPLSEAAEVHETSFNTEVPTNTYHTYLFWRYLYIYALCHTLHSIQITIAEVFLICTHLLCLH